MSFLEKLQKKVRKFRKNVNKVKEISGELNSTRRTLNSMKSRAHKPASEKLEDVKVTARKIGDAKSEGKSRFFGIGKDEKGFFLGSKRGPG